MNLLLHINPLTTGAITLVRDLEHQVATGYIHTVMGPSEPFSRLANELSTRVREFVFALVRKRRIPVLMVTRGTYDIADPAHVTRLG